MSEIVDWGYYSSLHTVVAADDFERAEKLAEKEVQNVVGWIRWANINEETYGYEQLKDCICNVIDKMAIDAKSGAGKGLSSASNDGYSENYVVQTESQARSELHSAIRSWLSGTGLVGAY